MYKQCVKFQSLISYGFRIMAKIENNTWDYIEQFCMTDADLTDKS